MNNDDYKHKIDEHRKPITLENETRSNSRVNRRSTKPTAEKSKTRRNLLLPILFTIFILIPVGFLIYIQAFYEPNQNETAIANDGEYQYEVNEHDSTDVKPDVTTEETEPVEPVEPVPAVEEEDIEGEVTQEEQEEPIIEEPSEPETTSKTHVVQPNETLYRIAMNYYNSPDAVQKIKDANGLTSDSISSGQTLILP